MKSIEIEPVADGVRVRVRPWMRWSQGWVVMFPAMVMFLAWQLFKKQPAVPFVSRWAPLAGFVIVGLGALLLAAGSASMFLWLADALLMRGTIEARREGVKVDLRGVWPKRVEMPAGNVRHVRAVPGGVRAEDRYQRAWQPSLVLSITPTEGKAPKLLGGRDPEKLTAAASAITRALGIGRDERRREWLAQQDSHDGLRQQHGVLGYGEQTGGATINVSAERVVLSLPPRGPMASRGTITITGQTVEIDASAKSSLSYPCEEIHWVTALDQAMGFGPLAIIMEDGLVVTVFVLRPMAEMRYVAEVMNGALGLSSGARAKGEDEA